MSHHSSGAAIVARLQARHTLLGWTQFT